MKLGTFLLTVAFAGGTVFLAAGSVSAQGDGAALFANDCARCHGDNLEGGEGPPLVGPGNALNTYKTAGAILQYAMENMPNDQPATLSPTEYAAIVGFILSKHGITVPEVFTPDVAIPIP
jgi:mono/diheme cytochrome c family protein